MEFGKEKTATHKEMEETSPYICGLCGMEYRSEDSLEKHIDQHTCDKKLPFDEDTCQKEDAVDVNNSLGVGRADTHDYPLAESGFEDGVEKACPKLIIKQETNEETNNLYTAYGQASIFEKEHISMLETKPDYENPNIRLIDIANSSYQSTEGHITPLLSSTQSSVLPPDSSMKMINERDACTNYFYRNSEQWNESSKLDTPASHSIEVKLEMHATENLSQLEMSKLDDKIMQNAITDLVRIRQNIDVTQFWLDIGKYRPSVPKTNIVKDPQKEIAKEPQKKITKEPKKKIAKGPSQYHCSLCDTVCGSAQHMRQHMTCHSDIRPNQCSMCPRKYKHKMDLKYHMETHLDIRRYACELCDYKSLRKSHLKVHMDTHRQKTVECEVCNKKFKSADGLKLHSRIHTGETAVQCPICDKTITQPNYLKIHMNIHTGVRPYKCGFCDKSFLRQHQMKDHEKIHENARAFVCHLCGKSFNTNACLASHMFSHNGGKKKIYECEICSKAFISPGAVKEHKMRIHDVGVKPYNCETCGECFVNRRDLRRHNLSHTGEKPYKCDYCSARFTQHGTRNTHMLIHTGAKPQECKICDMKFRHLSSLNNHMKKHVRNGEISDAKDK